MLRHIMFVTFYVWTTSFFKLCEIFLFEKHMSIHAPLIRTENTIKICSDTGALCFLLFGRCGQLSMYPVPQFYYSTLRRSWDGLAGIENNHSYIVMLWLRAATFHDALIFPSETT